MSAVDDMLALWNSESERCGVILRGDRVVEIDNYVRKIGLGEAEFLMRKSHVKKALKPEGMDAIVGIFHTHPKNTERPSRQDVAGWPALEGVAYYIVTQNKVLEWKLVGANPVLVAQAGSSLVGRVPQVTG